MKNEKPTETGVIAVFVEGLQNTPGWMSLSRSKQDEILEHTSRIQQSRQLQMLGEFGELMELYRVQQLLESEDMKMADYLQYAYPERPRRAINRRLAIFSQIAPNIPYAMLKRFRSLNAEVLSRFDRISRAALGDVRNAVRELPALPASTEKEAEKYLEALNEKILEQRKRKRRGVTLHRDETTAAQFATNALINYMRSCGLETSAQKRHFLTKVVGWTMEAHAVPGNIRVVRVPIPDGVILRRGRPRTRKKKKEA